MEEKQFAAAKKQESCIRKYVHWTVGHVGHEANVNSCGHVVICPDALEHICLPSEELNVCEVLHQS